MTRKQLVSGLRSLHENTIINNIRKIKRSGAIVIDYCKPGIFVKDSKEPHVYDRMTPPVLGQLIIAEPNPQPKTKKPKS